MNITFKYSLIEESSKFVFRTMYWIIVKTCPCFYISRIKRFDTGGYCFTKRACCCLFVCFTKILWDLNLTRIYMVYLDIIRNPFGSFELLLWPLIQVVVYINL